MMGYISREIELACHLVQAFANSHTQDLESSVYIYFSSFHAFCMEDGALIISGYFRIRASIFVDK